MEPVWSEFLKIVRERAGSQVVETWFKAAHIEQWLPERNEIVIRAPNQFVSNWIREHYLDLFKNHLSPLLNTCNPHVSFVCARRSEPLISPSKTLSPLASSAIPHTPPPLPTPPSPSVAVAPLFPGILASRKTRRRPSGLNEEYVFETFVTGPSNSLAHAAAHAVSQKPGLSYNPLFIYGGTGLGKTHLLHAIGNEVKKNKEHPSVCYTTAEQFTSDFIESIRADKVNQFKEKYRRVELFMLDDIQFFSRKEQTLEAFFQIFNLMYEQGKQMVLSSDTFPREIEGLPSRLKSRMEWGLIADIQPPTLETKLAILRKKADVYGFPLSEEVAHFIALHIASNIRELEGALTKVAAVSALHQQPVSLEEARKILLHLGPQKKDGVTLAAVIHEVALHYKCSVAQIKSKSKHKNITSVRQIALYLMKKMTTYSLETIGSFVGGRDHSTVCYAIKKVEDMIEHSSAVAQTVSTLEHKIVSYKS